MEIKQNQSDSKGFFYYEVDGVEKAKMTYSNAGKDKIIIDHTEIDEALRGQGVGYKLVEAAVEFARKQHIKILPLCPFAAAVFRKRDAYKDVLF